MSSKLLAVADAIVAALNTESLEIDFEFEAERLFLPEFDLRDMKTLHVTVIPRDETTEQLTRNSTVKTMLIDIGVQMKLEKVSAECIDPLIDLVDELGRLFNGYPLTAVPGAVCTVVKPTPIYDQDHMQRLRQFTSVLALTVKVYP